MRLLGKLVEVVSVIHRELDLDAVGFVSVVIGHQSDRGNTLFIDKCRVDSLGPILVSGHCEVVSVREWRLRTETKRTNESIGVCLR